MQNVSDIILAIDLIFIEAKLPAPINQYVTTIEKAYVQLLPIQTNELIEHYLHAPVTLDSPQALYLFLYDLTQEGRFIEKITQTLPSHTSPAQFYEIYWNLYYRLYSHSEHQGKIDNLRNLFDTISSNTRAWFKQYGYMQPKKVKQIKRVAILSPQILGMRNSPTREAVNLACHLDNYHNCETFIINTNGLSYHNQSKIIHPVNFNNYDEHIDYQELNIDYMQFNQQKIRLLTFKPEPMSSRKILDILDTLKKLDIDAVISHGENLLIQDMVYQTYPSLFASTDISVPFAHCDCYFIATNLFDAKAQSLANRFHHHDFFAECTIIAPEGKPIQTVDKAQYGLTQNSFIYLVIYDNNSDELSPEFISVCEQLLEQHPQSHILFAGPEPIELDQLFAQQFCADNRVINTGGDEYSALCAIANVYLNPKNSGGITNSQTAMLNELPVVTLDYADISSVVPTSHRHNSWQEYLDYASALQAPEYLAQEQLIFAQHYLENLKTREQIARMYDKLCQIAEQNYQ